MRTNSAVFAAAGIATLLSLSACSSEEPLARAVEESKPPAASEPALPEEPQEEETPEPENPDLPSDEDIKKYVEAVSADSVDALQDARELAVPDGPADGYLRYQAHYHEADRDAGFPAINDTDRINAIDDGFESCGSDGCFAFTDFAGENGKIYSFAIEGRPVEDHLILGDGSVQEGPFGSEITFVSAYENAKGTHLFVAYELRSGATALVSPMASYRSPSGRQSQSEMTVGAYDLAPDSMSHYYDLIPSGELGGDLYLEILTSDYLDSGEVTISTEME